MEWIHIIVGCISTWGLVECYSHESILNIKKNAKKAVDNGSNFFLWKLLSCTFCTSHWVAFGVSLLLTYFHHNIILTFLYWWIFVRCANFLNDITYEISRTPTSSKFATDDKI